MADFIITCPSCNTQFEPGDSIREEVEKKLRGQMRDWQKTKDEEFRQKEALLQQQIRLKDEETEKRIEAEKKKLQEEIQVSIRQSISKEYENQLILLRQNAADSEEKLKDARKKELEFLQKEQSLKAREEELQITLQRQLLEEREKLKEQIQTEEKERSGLKEQEFQLRMREKDKQLEDQKKLVEEMRRKAEQGSTQMQGEVLELMLEELLQATFPFDKVEEVGKGVRGADCIQTVRNQFGNEAGRIIYESKRTKDFSHDWIEKLKADMRTLGADIAVIVTQALPKDMERFGERDGVYICTFTEVKSVALLLRNAILRVHDAKKGQENKGDKMAMLYDYLIGTEFSEQWKAIREGFLSMKLSIQRERDAMEKLWKAREKQLEKVLLNAAAIKGSVEGIAGNDVNLSLLEDNDPLLLE
ncbi:DUF2130 domain-containing protein [Sediminibacterium soli]|uniref:DUF2130 domain-containing protein n=1 Tax=Sediminibacterium soli TaxID=2698829 RepID=UPI00137955DF|nr:DUF2130 domain-containing protein [Sediminibacterium soli]NCI47023.1 DUF2130 domain-containing protein [Sediminibacterium soli]